MAKPSETKGAQALLQRSTTQRGALSRYLHEIENIPVLTPDEERELATRAQRGDVAAQKELVRRNLRFVVTVARQYARHGVPLEDLINEGNIGLMRATTRFDPSRGFRLISYAVWWIRQSILSYLTDQSRVVRIPAGKVQGLARLARETERLMQECGCVPGVDQLAARLKLTPDQVKALLNLPTHHFSLDEPAEGEDSDFEVDTLEDPSSSTEDWLIETLRTHDIESALNVLHPREADILRRYFGLGGLEPESLQSIGQDYGVTRERVRQLRDRALWKLRTSVHAPLLAEYAS
jgi:RNA polymerase primary sigma factor